MVSDQLYTDFGESVSVSYERLNELSEKIDFVIDLKEAVMDDQLLKHIPETNYRTLLTIIFKLCTSVRQNQVAQQGVTCLMHSSSPR